MMSRRRWAGAIGALVIAPLVAWALIDQARSTRALRVTVNGQAVHAPAGSLKIVPGQVVQLKVEIVEPDGRSVDVTTHPGTHYFPSVNPLVTIAPGGRITARAPSPGERDVSRALIVQIAHSRGPGDNDALATVVLVDLESVDPNELVVSASKTTLGVGETATLTVRLPARGGDTTDVTRSAETQYTTANEYIVVVDDRGTVTAVGLDKDPGYKVTVRAYHKGGSGSAQFHVVEGGPGPTLDVRADRTAIGEGEATQLHVTAPGDATPRDLTSTDTGTRYLVFAGTGTGRPGTEFLDVDAMGRATAAPSLGRFSWLEPLVFVRNGERVGWTRIRIGLAPR